MLLRTQIINNNCTSFFTIQQIKELLLLIITSWSTFSEKQNAKLKSEKAKPPQNHQLPMANEGHVWLFKPDVNDARGGRRPLVNSECNGGARYDGCC